jgi:hypothetical protein
LPSPFLAGSLPAHRIPAHHSRRHSISGESAASQNIATGVSNEYIGSVTGTEDDDYSVKSRTLVGNGVKRVTPKSSKSSKDSESAGMGNGKSDQKIQLEEKDESKLRAASRGQIEIKMLQFYVSYFLCCVHAFLF